MKRTVDARGLVCPEPVMMTSKTHDGREVTELLAIVDHQAALENVSGLAQTINTTRMVEEQEGTFFVNISKEEVQPYKEKLRGSTVVLVTSNVLGQGDDVLGAMLMKSLIYTFTQMDGEIKSLIFLNSGVLLTTAGSQLLDHLQHLERNGVELYSCSTSLDFYGLPDKLGVGKVGNMYAIAEEMLHAAKVISI